ncbi:MAG: valyl-tRNA ligase [Candidatus Yanofskybacteria bacterium GW2011_GWD1_39_16]|uniref:Valine--tRNA ligase n=1 Tax=Candidatus Yanofskybacteria bacterium GW2011_GWD1_39_16 TaxID=1619030 RepID=A0A837HSM6_9BACT|nr:MAG: valyl-tRNA ligase [Candidatus Yanofskybacteria bacterium GW2011_GWD1_39_16]
MREIPKNYDHLLAEDYINKKWADAQIFDPDRTNINGKPFFMVFPPANVTGILHLGHALTTAVEDLIIRFRRMQGYRTLYIPGTDHAAIATQAKVEADIYKKDDKRRQDFSHDEFLQMVKQYADGSQKTILGQLKRLGASVDWNRLAYTLDDQRSKSVRVAFKKLFDMGLIYRGHRLVNWDPKLQTNVSDDEIEWKEEKTNFYYFKFGPFVISTSRPETKFGDKCVVMHPDDSRYAQYKEGQKIEIEWINGPIEVTVIKDEAIDMTFGTGVMTITPAHDQTDYEIAKRHNLEFVPVIDLDGKLLPIAEEFTGMYITKARALIIKKLKSRGLLEKIDEEYIHRIATNSRGGGVIEPQIREQWFIAVEKPFKLEKSRIDGIADGEEVTLKQLMRKVIDTNQIQILPDYFIKTYLHWIDNLRDWCISRQIVFGHQIPVWYRDSELYCDVEAPSSDGSASAKASAGTWKQDSDTLDTWFSSSLWTFSTLGWPDDTDEFKFFHPAAVMETGYDILFFWVARMILMSTALLGQIPFKTVYLHGLVRDPEKKKMSKSTGNVINPLDVSAKYGTDALRFALVFANAGGTDMAFMEERVKGMKHFGNKIWNIARFITTNTLEVDPSLSSKSDGEIKATTDADKDILEKLNSTIAVVTKNIEDFRFNEGAQNTYDFIWHEFADKYLEASKPQLLNPEQAENTKLILLFTLKQSLKLLHPFMPFITEYVWELLQTNTILAVEKWPVVHN